MLIYKILRAPEWDALQSHGEIAGAPIDVADGYVHLSTAAQAEETAAKHFKLEDNLVLLALNADDLGAGLKWEVSRNDDLFPHYYGPLRLSDIVWHKALPLENGAHVFPDDLV